MKVYLDNAATTPIRPEVVDTMIPFMREHYGNPSSIHATGRKVRAAIEEARKVVAHAIGASIGEIFFTSGGTESNNMAIKCAVRDLGVTRIISSPVEHHCVLHTLEGLEGTRQVTVEYLAVDSYGRPDLDELATKLQSTDAKTLVSLMHANNEIGTMIDIAKVGDLCHTYGAYFHSDTVQTVGHYEFDVQNLHIDFMSGAAHKFHGPKGVGFIYVNNSNQIKPLIDGGSQERNMRAGTENVYGIIGMADALKRMLAELEEEREHIESLSIYMRDQLHDSIPHIQFNGDPGGEALYTVLNVSFPPSEKSEMLLLALDIAGIYASGGSACSSGAERGSHVMNAIGADPARKSVRFSFSMQNTKEEIDYTIAQLKKLFPSEKPVVVSQV